MNKNPANLTLLSKNNGGVFPEGEVRDFIVGTRTIASHGSREMPVWAYAFMFRQDGLARPFVPVLTPQEANYRINLLQMEFLGGTGYPAAPVGRDADRREESPVASAPKVPHRSIDEQIR